MYALATNTNGNVTLVACDKTRAKDLPGHAEFWATIFYSLSQFAFLQNAVTGRREKLPCFSDPFWTGKTSTGLVWASNISITSKGFNNEAHVDKDLSSYTFGVFCYCLSDTGEIYLRSLNSNIGYVKGASFWLDAYNVKIDFDACDGVIEMVWRSDTPHHSSPSTTHDAQGNDINPKKAPFTRFGSSCQISKSLVGQVRFMLAEKLTMSPAEWDTYCEGVVKDYEQETKYRKSGGKKGEAQSSNHILSSSVSQACLRWSMKLRA